MLEATAAPFRYNSLAVPDAKGLVFGIAPHPVKCGFGLEIGTGPVFAEVNFTLPPIGISDETWPEILLQY